MLRQMMKRKHPSSTPALDEREARQMADQVADKLARSCISMDGGPKNLKKRRTIPLHDPFFVGTPEEEARHLQRLRESVRKRKSEDYTPMADTVAQGTNAVTVPELLAAANLQRLNKVARRSKMQTAAVDIDALNRQLSSVGISDAATDGSANPCRAVVLYTPNPLSRPTISTVEEPDDLPDQDLPFFSLRRYGSRFPLKVEDLSKALIIYPEEHPLQEVIDKIKDYERRTGKSNVRIEELTTSLDDIDDEDDHSLRMLEELSSAHSDDDDQGYITEAPSPYVVEVDEDADGDDEGECDSVAQVDEETEFEEQGCFDNSSPRFVELTDDDFTPVTTATSTSTSPSSTAAPFASWSAASSDPFLTSAFSPSSSSTSPFVFSAPMQEPPPAGASWSSPFLSAPPVFSNTNPFASTASIHSLPSFSAHPFS